jgi:plastocyanin
MRAPAVLLPAAAAAALAAAAAGATGCGSSAKGGSTPAGTSAAAPTTTSKLEVGKTPKYASPSTSQPVQGGTVQIAYRNITIAPDTLRVKAGTTVRWTNFDPVEHNVTAMSGPQRFKSANFGERGTFQVTLARPGIYHYQCTIHPATMNGTIQVVP